MGVKQADSTLGKSVGLIQAIIAHFAVSKRVQDPNCKMKLIVDTVQNGTNQKIDKLYNQVVIVGEASLWKN